MEKRKETRKSLKIYLTCEERALIDNYATRLGFSKTGEIVRIAILALASDPAYDFLLDPGSLLREDPKRVKARLQLYKKIDQILDIMKSNNIDLPDLKEQEGSIDE